jgi:hypothetical protein
MDGKCGKEWSRKFLVQTFSKTFLNGPWRKNVEKKLLDKEMALLPATQCIVEAMHERERIVKEVWELDRQIRELDIRRRALSDQARSNIVVKKATTHFVRGCPSSECRGFLSSQWKCGLCENWTCPDCHVVKGIERDCGHVCNADELATAKLLDSDTKPCPKCATGIFKIEGCDQMWCTQCQTAFSWKTGHIESQIHNPHFFEWQRKNGGAVRAPGEVLCGREITHYTPNLFTNILRPDYEVKFSRKVSEEICKQISSICRRLIHLRITEMPQYRVDNVENNQDLRVKYMRKEIDIDTFKTRIHRDNKKFEKKRETYAILGMFIQNVTDIVWRAQDLLEQNKGEFSPIIVPQLKNKHSISGRAEIEAQTIAILNEIEPLRQYINDCLAEIAQTYGSKPKAIIPLAEGKADVIFHVLVDVAPVPVPVGGPKNG